MRCGRRDSSRTGNLVVVSDAFTESDGAAACRELLDADGQMTAIAAANDLIALGCYDVLAERGIGCPDGLSIVGFNDMPFAGRFQPPLTTIRIPHYELGAAAAELMLERLQEGAMRPARYCSNLRWWCGAPPRRRPRHPRTWTTALRERRDAGVEVVDQGWSRLDDRQGRG